MQEALEEFRAPQYSKLGKVPVTGEPRLRVELLTGVSRQADGVVSDLSALPLSHEAM